MYSKKISNCLFLVIFFSMSLSYLQTDLFAQDISSGIKLIRNEKYSEAKKYFSSMVNGQSKAQAYFYLGQIYFMENNIDSAKLSYSAGVSADIEFPLNYAGLVKISMLNKNQAEADKNQMQAIELGDENNPDVYIILSEAYSNSKAIELLNTALKVKSGYIPAHIALGKVYIKQGNGTDAIKNFTEVLDDDPTNPEALTLKAKVYALISNHSEAITLLNEAIANDPSYSAAYYELAELNYNLKDYAQASEFYGKYIEASEITLEKRKRYASILYLNKEYPQAINILEDVIKTEPDNPVVIRTLAYSYFRSEDIENSSTYFKKLFELQSADYLPSDYENYAELLGKTGNDSLAVEYLYKIVDQDSTRKDILGRISVIQFKNKNWNGVITALERKETLTAQEYFDLGKAYFINGDMLITKVSESLKNSLTLNDEQMIELRTSLLYYQKDISNGQQPDLAADKVGQSVESFLTSSQKSQWSSLKDQWLGDVKTNVQQDYVNADTTFGTLSSKVPELAIAYFWRARIKTNFDPESEEGLAKPFYEQFIATSKEDTTKYKKELIEAFSYLGYYYYLASDMTKSLENWQKVLSIDPENKQAVEAVKNLR